MAVTLSLVRSADMATPEGTLDLTGYNAGFTYAQNGWAQNMLPYGGEEVITLRAKRGSANAVASDLQTLAGYIERVNGHLETNDNKYVWLYAKADGETNARRAVITSMQMSGNGAFYDRAFTGHSQLLELQLSLTRGPWESTSYTNISGPIGQSDYTIIGTVASGDVPSRIAYTMLSGGTGEYWVGLKSTKYLGGTTTFDSRWDCEDGTQGDDTSTTSDVTAAGGSKSVCTFSGGSSMANRITITPYAIDSTNYANFRGNYHAIARLKCTGTSGTCYTRIAQGLGTSTAELAYNESVSVSGTSWKLYDHGVVSLPCGGETGTFDAMRYSNVILQAQRYAGTASLDMDFIAMIPCDEGFAHTNAVGSGGGNHSIVISPTGKVFGWDSSTHGAVQTTGTKQDSYNAPTGYFITVMAFQSSSIGDAGGVGFMFYPRWNSLRGAS